MTCVITFVRANARTTLRKIVSNFTLKSNIRVKSSSKLKWWLRALSWGISSLCKILNNSFNKKCCILYCLNSCKIGLFRYSTYTEVNEDLPQGSILGPMLFILFINDLPDVIPPGPPKGGATCPGPQTTKGTQLEKYPKIEQSAIKIGASIRHERLHLKALKVPI